MGVEKALVQVLDGDGCVIGWALQTTGGGGAAGSIPAGTNNIGDVDIASALPAGTNNIGDVDIAEVPYLTVTGTFAASGDNTLVAAPVAGSRLVIVGLTVQNESAVSTTIILKSGATAKRRALLKNQGDGLGLTFAPGREWLLDLASALVLNLSGANSHGYTVDYYTRVG